MGIHDQLRQMISKWDNRIFAAKDAEARVRGWEIARPPKGFGRVYRDPRWDLISACDMCGGGGGSVTACQSCGGYGTVRRSLTDSSPGGAA